MSHLSLFFALLSTECSRIANAKLSERWIMNIEWKRDEKEKEKKKEPIVQREYGSNNISDSFQPI